MKRCILLAFCFLALAPAGFAVDKEVIRLEQEVAQLQGMVRDIQRSFDEKMAVMQSLLTQSTDKINMVSQFDGQISAGIGEMQKSVQVSVANAGQKVDSLNSQIQGLQSSMDELRARLDKISEQVAKIAAASQNLSPSGGVAAIGNGEGASGAGGSGFPTGGSGPPTGNFPGGTGFDQGIGSSPAATPDVLYNSALRDYTGGNYPLAYQEFSDYLRYYPTNALASNAQFYLGDIFYQQGQFQRAIQEYDKAMEQYPNGNKSAAAQLKKGYAYLNMDMRAQGSRELSSLVRRFPNTPEAALARDKLTMLGPEKSAVKPRRKLQ